MRREHRIPSFLLIAALLLFGSGIFSRAPVVDAITRAPASDVGLSFTTPYLLLAPVMGLLDHLTLLTDRQHIVFLVSVVVCFAGWRVARGCWPVFGSWSAGRECLLAGGGLAMLIAFYGFGVVGVRPMAALRAYDADLMIVDFHSHSDASHDVRSDFDAQARRRWHEAAGFDLVYLTDHGTVEAATRATLGNPRRAGEGISLLPGREMRFRGQHVVVLGVEDPTALSTATPWPTLIQTIPNDLSRVPMPAEDGTEGVHAIELVDADPRGLRQSADERATLLAIADSLDLALIAGSNHHGWGRAAAAWNLIRLPGWRERSPEAVGSGVEARLRNSPSQSVRVVERPRLGGSLRARSVLHEAMTLPRLAWHILVHLTPPERASWLAWVGIAGLLHVRFRGSPSQGRRPLEASSPQEDRLPRIAVGD